MADYIELDDEVLTHCKNSSDFKLPSGCGSWIEYYKDQSNLSSPKCAQFGCSNAASLGAHVEIRGRRGIWNDEKINIKKGTRAVKDTENS